MPFKVGKHKKCGVRGFAIMRADTGAVVGCSKTKKAAHISASIRERESKDRGAAPKKGVT